MTASVKSIRAETLEQAWLNFEPDAPLTPLPGGKPNPYYVDRPDNPAIRLEDELTSPFREPPKRFLSGHRGCGKSTELKRLALSQVVRSKYLPVYFSIRDEADVNNLDYKDILLAIGSHIYRECASRGNEIPEALEQELQEWRGKVVEEVTRAQRVQGIDIEGGLEAFFARLGGRIKLEPSTRREVRQVIEHDVLRLIDLINEMASVIKKQSRRVPLVLIDDLDKPDHVTTKAIFHDHREAMLQIACGVVYTVPPSLFYTREFHAIRDRAYLLPNVSIKHRGKAARRDPLGFDTMREFAARRMNLGLISPRALDDAIRLSGGLFAEMARIIRSAILRAYRQGRIDLPHVQDVESEIRGEYRRILTGDQLQLLRSIRDGEEIRDPERLAPLLQILAVFEYAQDGEPWYDIHPALISMLGEAGANSSGPSPA